MQGRKLVNRNGYCFRLLGFEEVEIFNLFNKLIWLSTMSDKVIFGNLDPYLLPSDANEAGPVDP